MSRASAFPSPVRYQELLDSSGISGGENKMANCFQWHLKETGQKRLNAELLSYSKHSGTKSRGLRINVVRIWMIACLSSTPKRSHKQTLTSFSVQNQMLSTASCHMLEGLLLFFCISKGQVCFHVSVCQLWSDRMRQLHCNNLVNTVVLSWYKLDCNKLLLLLTTGVNARGAMWKLRCSGPVTTHHGSQWMQCSLQNLQHVQSISSCELWWPFLQCWDWTGPTRWPAGGPLGAPLQQLQLQLYLHTTNCNHHLHK